MTLSKTLSSEASTELGSKMSASESSFSTEDSTSTASDDSSMNRPVLHRRRDTSNKKPTRISSSAISENNKVLKSSTSTHRLKQFKKKLASTLIRKSDSYQKINKIDESSRNSNGGETKRFPSRSNSSKSTMMQRPADMRRSVSCNDDFHTMYNAVARVRGRDSNGDLDSFDEGAGRRHSVKTIKPLHADNSFFEGNGSYARNGAFARMPNVLSSPNLPHFTGRTAPTPNTSFSSKSSKASIKSTNDLLRRAASVAGRNKFNQQTFRSPSSKPMPIRKSTSIGIMPTLMNRLDAPQPASSSSPHLFAIARPLSKQKKRRQSDSAMDLEFFRKHLEAIESSPNSPPSVEDKRKQPEQLSSSRDHSAKSEYTGISNNRRRSKRHYHNEIVMEPKQRRNTDNSDKRRAQQTKDHELQLVNQFRKDFPDDPIPSDAILMRLYSNIPPPPPYINNNEEQAAAKNNNSIHLSKTLGQSVISPEDLKKNGDATSYLTFDSSIEWKEAKRNARLKHSPTEDTTNDASRRSESSKSGKTSSSSSRRSSQLERQHTDGTDHPRSNSGNRSHKSRFVSKVKAETSTSGRKIRSNDISSSMHDFKASKRKGNRREGLSLSAHAPIKSKKKGESSKVKNKRAMLSPKPKAQSAKDLSRNSKRDHAQNSSRSLSHNSSAGSHTFNNALLDLSNGSFYDSTNHDASNHTTRDSLAFLRTSLTKLNSNRSVNNPASPQHRRHSHSFNDSGGLTSSGAESSAQRRRHSHSFNESGGLTSSGAESFVEYDEKMDRERRRRRRGKRSSSVSSKRQSRSRSSEGGTGTKTRRGKRGSKSKLSSDDSYQLDESESLDFEGSLHLNDIHAPLSREGSRKNIRDENGGKSRRSPKVVSKNGNEHGATRRRSPKVVSKKNLRDESGGKHRRSPKNLVRKNSVKHEQSSSPRSTSRKKVSVPQSPVKNSLKHESSSSPRSTSRKKAAVPQSPVKNDRTEFDGPHSRIVNDQDFKPISPKFSKDSPDLDRKKEEDFYDLALSSWVERPKETTKQVSPRGKSHSAIRTPDLPRRRASSRKNTRWLSEISPAQTSEIDTTAARFGNFSEETLTPKEEDQMNFPLDFLEYTDVSPLTVASRKVRRNDIENELRSLVR